MEDSGQVENHGKTMSEYLNSAADDTRQPDDFQPFDVFQATPRTHPTRRPAKGQGLLEQKLLSVNQVAT